MSSKENAALALAIDAHLVQLAALRRTALDLAACYYDRGELIGLCDCAEQLHRRLLSISETITADVEILGELGGV